MFGIRGKCGENEGSLPGGRGVDLEPERKVEFDLVEKGKRFPRLSEECELHLIFPQFPLAAIQALWRTVIAGGTSVGKPGSV